MEIRTEIELFNADDIAIACRGYVEVDMIRSIKAFALVDIKAFISNPTFMQRI